jgi:DNA-binding NtrC family response regulator
MVARWLHISSKRRFIAVVNDEPELAYLFMDTLSQIVGAEVLAFTDPIKGLEHFKSNYREYALLFSDCRMPGMNGIELLKKAKEIAPSVPRILICVYDHGVEQECVDKFLIMPISMRDLIREVKECIRLSKTKGLKK